MNRIIVIVAIFTTFQFNDFAVALGEVRSEIRQKKCVKKILAGIYIPPRIRPGFEPGTLSHEPIIT